jgi:hypothetical protein
LGKGDQDVINVDGLVMVEEISRRRPSAQFMHQPGEESLDVVGETNQMDQKSHQIPLSIVNKYLQEQDVIGEYVTLLGDSFYKIHNFDMIEPFFMSIVSSSDHWLFIASNGGLSAGRVNSEQALFPYYTEDKLADNYDNTGNKTILRVMHDNQVWLWEPFTARQYGQYDIERNLYKNVHGTALVFEEINRSLELKCRYAWRTSEKFGFVKTVWIGNQSSLSAAVQVEFLDGVQNILPANVSSTTQSAFSCLLDAYKRSELNLETGLGIFVLNSTLTDLAEPSESLLTTTVFQVGLAQANHLLSSMQLERFRSGMDITPELEVRGRRGAYFVHARIALLPREEATWHIVADTHQDAADIVNLQQILRRNTVELYQEIEQDIKANAEQLHRIVASADGWQICADRLRTSHHFANVMFNVMRGGIIADQYWIDTADFIEYVSTHLKQALQIYVDFFSALPEKIHVSDLLSRVDEQGSADLARLGYTYLPLTFSRRHGDPSRPWNKFSINIKKPDGTVRLDYEGNWRDIFQNWEALAYSYPEFVESMIFTFLSATTADGYNPYRITRSGLEWEIPEPGNPWANIGYWSDHQIIYLQKLMELSTKVHPDRLHAFLDRPILSYANIPYHIKPYPDLIKDPYNTIHFDHAIEKEIDERVNTFGTDGKLLYSADGQVLHRSLAEKLLTLLLGKLVNFVPEGGIWMNTQRPEWNDANNALVGKGLSVVTLGYLRRYVVFCYELFNQAPSENFHISQEVAQLYAQIIAVLECFQPNLAVSFDHGQRRAMMDALGQAGSDYRWNIYTRGFSGGMAFLSKDDLLAFLELSKRYIEHSLRSNQRSDQLYHTYNILHLGENSAGIGHLQEMLEGQVAILSSKLLSGDESLALLQSLQSSALYRADQHTYILYPDKTLPSFLAKNTLTADQVKNLRLPAVLADAQDKTLFVRDVNDKYHFSGQLHNTKDVNEALEVLAKKSQFAEIVGTEKNKIAALFEEVFQHTEFTGRSGTFFAYEGLGSIYWHMVSKLLLATQETALRCQDEPASTGLVEKYYQVCAGLGFNKTPGQFGSFPTDPYSHTPKGQGARQPGMTGLVKEEILARQAEVGWAIENGCLIFTSLLFNPKELLTAPGFFDYVDVTGKSQRIDLPAGSLAYTICEVPIVIQLADAPGLEIYLTDGAIKKINDNRLDAIDSRHIFQRDGFVHHLMVYLSKA